MLRLSPEQRDTLLLVAEAGLSYEEAALVCSCAIGTIKSRVDRARHRLEELLEIQGKNLCRTTATDLNVNFLWSVIQRFELDRPWLSSATC